MPCKSPITIRIVTGSTSDNDPMLCIDNPEFEYCNMRCGGGIQVSEGMDEYKYRLFCDEIYDVFKKYGMLNNS